MKNPIPSFGKIVLIAGTLTSVALATQAQSVWNAIVDTSANTNWSTAANWTPPAVPGSSSNVVFNTTAAAPDGVTINNVVDSLFGGTIASLTYSNTTSGSFENTLIASGKTLNITGSGGLTVGSSTVSPASGVITTVAISGSGAALVVSNNSASIYVAWGNASGATGPATLVMSNLDTFSANVSRLLLGQGGVTRSSGVVYLAKTNTITVTGTGTTTSAAIVVGDNSANNGNASTLYLGETNAINANNIGCGLRKENNASGIKFNPAFTNNNPTAYFRANDGVSAVNNWFLGDGTGASATDTETGVCDFTGGSVNALINLLILARPSSAASGGYTANATFTMSAGVIRVGTVTNGVIVSATGPEHATGVINVNGGTFTVTTNLVLGSMNGFSAGSPSGTLNVTNGNVQAQNILAGGGVSAINVVGGSLTVSNTAGTATAPLTSLYISNSVLQVNVSGSTVPVDASTLYMDGTTNIINILSLPGIVPPAQFSVIAYGSLNNISSGGTFNYGLGTLPGAYQGYISNNTANSSVDIVITGSQSKALTWNGNVNANWDLTTLNWQYSGSPANYLQGDYVTFDDSLTGTPTVNLATNVAPGAIAFRNSTHNYVVSGTNAITGSTLLSVSGSGTVTLMESGGDNFTGGIIVNSGVLVLDDPNSSILGGLTINGGTVQIGNNDANGTLPGGGVVDNGTLAFDQTGSITVSAAVSGSGALLQEGSGTLTLSGANLYTGTTWVNSGTLALGTVGTVSSSAGVAINGATLDVSSLTQPATLNALSATNGTLAVSVSPGLTPAIDCGSIAPGGTGNQIKVVSLPGIATYPVTFPILYCTNGIPPGSFNFTLAPLPNGATGSLSESADQFTVELTVTSGPTGTRGNVLWTGGDTSDATNWTDRLNWELPGAPLTTDNVLFNSTDGQSGSALSTPGGGAAALQTYLLNNYVNANFTISSLAFTNFGTLGSSIYQNTWINNGMTLAVTGSNSLTVGSTTVDVGAASVDEVTIAGTNATLEVNNTNGTLYVGAGSASSGAHEAVLDLSALGTFNATVSRFLVGVGSTSEGIGLAREVGVVYLAETNNITATIAVSGSETSDTGANAFAIDIGDNDGNAGNASAVYLGWSNSIFADAFCTGRQKQSAMMAFNPAFANPTAYFRAHDGISPISTWSVADGVVNGGTTTLSATNDFTLGAINMLVNTLYVGRAADYNGGSAANICTGVLSFGGLINAATVYVGLEQTNGAYKHGVGTLNVASNATLIVNNGLNLGFSAGGSGAAETSGTLDVTNGVVEAYSIGIGSNTVTTINIAGGTLIVTNPVASAAAPLGTLNLEPLNVPGNTATALYLPVRTNGVSGVTVTTLNIDGQSTTTNILNVESVGPVGATPVELPLISYTAFNVIDGVTNLVLGTLPSGYSGYLTNDVTQNMIAVVLTSALHPQPAFTSMSVVGTNFVASGGNGFANVPFMVLATTNVALPLSSWTKIGNGIFGPSGSFSLSAPISAATPEQFYILQVP